mgnify:CR=1 FL=1
MQGCTNSVKLSYASISCMMLNKLSYTFDKFVNEDELGTVGTSRYIRKIKDGRYMVFNVNSNYNIYTRKPIAIQIKEESRKRIYNMMCKLNLNENIIKSVHTDAITYIGDKLNDTSIIGNGLGQ